ncbi:hypothetical protein BKA56DRAFT_669813 [Ilyonectria sp. MPI-CAGE-AT-0026]|nr:hypothetical protein BKA56DRAFT_669813 [Ilyonectria sp. MPI-CAGE-AT-0026]
MSTMLDESLARKPLRSPYWARRWVKFIIPAAAVGLVLQFLFLGNMSYLYGAVFKSGTRAHALKVLALDYDGAEIGKSLSLAYDALKSDHFPTLEYRPASEYPTPERVREAICNEGYWAAIYTHSGASDRLMAAIDGTNTTAYNSSNAISYTYDAAFYPLVTASIVASSMQALVSAATRAYYGVSPSALSAVNLTDPMSSSVFLSPIQASSIVIMPTPQGTRALLNTVSMVIPILMQFFFIMGLNGIYTKADVFTKLSKRDVYFSRLFIHKTYTLLGALGMTGYIWAFREDWSVTSRHFIETWMCLWFYMEINFLVIDTVLEMIIPIPFFAIFMLTWIITNVSSTIYPFELSAGFYRWGYCDGTRARTWSSATWAK